MMVAREMCVDSRIYPNSDVSLDALELWWTKFYPIIIPKDSREQWKGKKKNQKQDKTKNRGVQCHST